MHILTAVRLYGNIKSHYFIFIFICYMFYRACAAVPFHDFKSYWGHETKNQLLTSAVWNQHLSISIRIDERILMSDTSSFGLAWLPVVQELLIQIPLSSSVAIVHRFDPSDSYKYMYIYIYIYVYVYIYISWRSCVLGCEHVLWLTGRTFF